MGDPIYNHQQFTGDRQQQQPLQRAMSSGLARYQSAPNSYFASLLDSSISDFVENYNEFVTPQPSTPQPDQVFPRFMQSGGSEGSSSHELHSVQQNSSVNNSLQSQFMAAPMKSESENYVHDHQQLQRQGSGYTSIPQIIHQNQSQSSLPNRTLPMSKPPIDSSYMPQMNISSGRSSNLLRQNSSPANFFTNFDIKGYCVSKNAENFGCDKKSNLEASDPSPNRLKRQHDYPSGLPSSSGIMTPISEIENKNMEMRGTGFAFGSWDDSDIFSDSLIKGLEDDERITFSGMNASENQNGEVGNHRPPTMLSHHLSLPKTSAMEKFMQLQDSVPCKIRAKRGCATHPRSIAERVRRTRISERMRKLQDLVPNMDKQTNTSDMLDLAVDYIKDLQNQLQTLSDNRARCTCSNQQTQ